MLPTGQCTLERFDTEYADRHRIGRIPGYWAAQKPDDTAIIGHEQQIALSWALFDRQTAALAAQLLRMGFRKGDFLAASLLFLVEHILLEYACFRIGVIHAPLDLRLKPAEVIRALEQIRARGYAFPAAAAATDFRELGRAVHRHCPFLKFLVQFGDAGGCIEGAIPFEQLAGGGELTEAEAAALWEAEQQVDEHDGAQVIFTTGSTGSPKPALLSHRGITCQNYCLGTGFEFGRDSRTLVNLPPSHVGGQSELLMTTLFAGGTAIVLQMFDPARSLEAIEKHGVDLLGQIPVMFNLEWRLSNYSTYDLSSLQRVVYGGQQASRAFLEKMAGMAPQWGTGLGLTEASGFCTYTRPGASLDELEQGLGYAMPAYPLSIREAMREDGTAGAELEAGRIGHICFRGPQTFLGYVGDPEATARTISRDGYLYTGDLGYQDGKGLHFTGRAKWVIKQAGYQIFPGDVENAIAMLKDKVASCAVVGAPHDLLVEAVVAFVEKKPGADLHLRELRERVRGLASYMRPMHYVILEPGQMPYNRSAKTDYLKLQEMARQEIEILRSRGRWDR